MSDMNTIASRLKYLRDRKDWTQTQLAVAADVSQGTVGNIESGKRVGKGSLIKLAKALGASLDWLLDGEGQMLTEDQKTIRERSNLMSAVTEIPLLNKGNAGMYRDYLDGTTQPTATHIHPGQGENLFAYSVDDDVMSPLVPQGCRAIISVKIKPKHGMCVLIDDGGQCYIRRLVIEGPTMLVEAPRYAARPLTGTIIGVVHQISMLMVDLGEDE